MTRLVNFLVFPRDCDSISKPRLIVLFILNLPLTVAITCCRPSDCRPGPLWLYKPTKFIFPSQHYTLKSLHSLPVAQLKNFDKMLLTLVIALLAGSVTSQSFDYCTLSAQNTLCKYKASKPPRCVIIVYLDWTMKLIWTYLTFSADVFWHSVYEDYSDVCYSRW